ncbi:MAG: SGNH/GDSL hydrolase family protein [Clostridia bacterium]|nr:SGNH/GDSL hydrolase family protein [Clostridia bacterium]
MNFFRLKNLFSAAVAAVMLVCLFAISACNGAGNSGVTDGSASDIQEGPDMTLFPDYVNPNEAEYAFGKKEIVTPYWRGNIIYNETVMLVDGGEGACGSLQYEPVKILSVRDFDYDEEYEEGKDYTVEGRVIKRTEGSAMPYLTEENLSGRNVPSPYREVTSISNAETDFVMMGSVLYTEGSLIYGHQIAVSYVYDVKDVDLSQFPSYKTSGLPKLKEKLATGGDVKIVITGDSVGEGCSSSGYFKRSPYMPNFITLATDNLKEKYPTANISMTNRSKGGMTSSWGTENAQVSAIIGDAPDVLFIHFGINDCGAGVGAGNYLDNIQSLILQVKASLPDCEFVFIRAFPPNGRAYDYDAFEKYWKRVDAWAQKTNGVYTLDMFSIGIKMLENKKYTDVTGNGINHLNDYTARLYAMAITAMLVEN